MASLDTYSSLFVVLYRDGMTERVLVFRGMCQGSNLGERLCVFGDFQVLFRVPPVAIFAMYDGLMQVDLEGIRVKKMSTVKDCPPACICHEGATVTCFSESLSTIASSSDDQGNRK